MSEAIGPSNEVARALNVVYFGTTGAFSVPPLEALLAAGVRVCAVVLPALAAAAPPIAARPARGAVLPAVRARPVLPLLTPFVDHTIVSLAAAHGIPVFEVARLAHPLTLATLGELRPDVICVACFSRRLPPALLALPRLGCLNVHPSLLPANRGPDPLFWTFHRGDRETGVTIHRMDIGLDSGPILAQQRVEVPVGIGEPALERELATRGAELLVHVVHQLAAGTARPAPQDERFATRFPWPSEADFVITPAWSARRAFGFSAGVAGRARPVLLEAGGRSFAVREPLGYDEAARLDSLWHLDGDVLALRCTPGVLRARVSILGEGNRGGRARDTAGEAAHPSGDAPAATAEPEEG
jgi:methionyl-tRNA formyltransferase